MGSVSEILTASATVIFAIALLIIAARGFKRLEAKVGNVHIGVEQVNRSVNNIKPGEPTLREHVVMIGAKLDTHINESNTRFDRLEDFVTKPRTGQVPVVKQTKSRKAS